MILGAIVIFATLWVKFENQEFAVLPLTSFQLV